VNKVHLRAIKKNEGGDDLDDEDDEAALAARCSRLYFWWTRKGLFAFFIGAFAGVEGTGGGARGGDGSEVVEDMVEFDSLVPLVRITPG